MRTEWTSSRWEDSSENTRVLFEYRLAHNPMSAPLKENGYTSHLLGFRCVQTAEVVRRSLFVDKKPSGRISIFQMKAKDSFNDRENYRVVLLFSLHNFRDYQIKTEWYDPNGVKFETIRSTLRKVDPEFSGTYATHSVLTSRMAGRSGKWRVDFWVDEALQETLFFHFTSDKPSSLISAAREGDIVLV